MVIREVMAAIMAEKIPCSAEEGSSGSKIEYFQGS
jgi:hypothetical protein